MFLRNEFSFVVATSVRAGLLLAFFSTLAARAQLPVSPDIVPTVTADQGDLGGRYFGEVPDPKRTRHYYVAAESDSWNYAPSGRDEMCGLPLSPSVVAAPRNDKVRYFQYTDATYKSRVFATPSLGILGPVLRGVVGEWITVTFLNRTSQPLSMHPHGVRYDKDSEGAYYRPGPGLGAAVGPGATFTYVWYLDDESGPLPTEPSSKAWLYHSHVSGDEETNLGLIGFIIVTDPKRARPDGTPADVDREFGTLFMIFDESGLGADAKEAAEYASLPGAAAAPHTFTEIQQLMEQGARYAINGRISGNLHGLEMNEGERVRWYLFGLGSEQDFHTAHWHGLRVVEEGRRRTDVVELMPASMKVADLVADNPGDWLFHCHIAEHMAEGMFTRLTVYAKSMVGVDRSPARAFLGLAAGEKSLRLTSVETSPAGADTFALKLTGEATVYEAFSVFNQVISLQIGGRSATFRPDVTGVAEIPGAELRIKNAGSLGVIYGGILQFEITVTGESWRGEVDKVSAAPPGGTRRTLPVSLAIGAARHTATVEVFEHAR